MVNNQEETGVNEQKQLLFETRSEEVQAIMGRMPSWLTRYGIGLIGVMLGVILGFAAYISYPDIVPVEIIIRTSAAPFRVTSKTGGIISKWYLQNGETVKKGQVLALIDNDASASDMAYIYEIANAIDTSFVPGTVIAGINTDTALRLGDWQTYYSDMRLGIIAVRRAGKKTSDDSQVDKLRESAEKVLRCYKSWEERYLLRAQTAGKIVIIKNENDVATPDELLALVSSSATAPHAQARIPIDGAGKIKSGQKVIIRLTAYPSQEFGVLEGRVGHISDIAVDDRYYADIQLDNGLVSDSKKQIPAQPELKGTGEILSSDRTVLQRILQKTVR